MASESTFLIDLGIALRAQRKKCGLSRKRLAEITGISERFLAQVEAGQGNISLSRYASLCSALELPPGQALDASLAANDGPSAIALIGVRGAGKSTVGKALSRELDCPFIEVDRHIEEHAGLSLGEIFMVHGEEYYRRLEGEVLEELLPSRQFCVLATGGSIINHTENFERLRKHSHTVWLKANPSDHWNRVLEQGDSRPMAKNPTAFAELEALLKTRAPLYERADSTVNTSTRSIPQVMQSMRELAERIRLKSC